MASVFLALAEDGRRTLKRARFFRNRTDILDTYDDERLIKDFRFPRVTILYLIDKCKHLQRKTTKKTALPIHIQVLAALRFYGRSTFQDDTKDIVGISQPSVSRALVSVTDVFCKLASEHIRFPTDEELSTVKQQFYEMNGIPNVIGIIDGSHIYIRSPSENQSLFLCHKGGHSINVQVVCGPNYTFTNIVAKWGGSTHDAFIWNNCGLRDTFVSNPPTGWLLGDSGYPCEPWLLTPYNQMPTTSHVRYNRAFAKSRNIVERSIGLWKSVFRLMDKSGGELQYSPKKICQFILATAVLHNLRRALRLQEDEEFELPPDFFDLESPTQNFHEPEILPRALATRDQVRLNFFSD